MQEKWATETNPKINLPWIIKTNSCFFFFKCKRGRDQLRCNQIAGQHKHGANSAVPPAETLNDHDSGGAKTWD